MQKDSFSGSMTPEPNQLWRGGLPVIIASIVTFIGAGFIYWKTAFPSINWWDSASYSLAAATLGVHSPPGSLLLTVLGWLVTRIPWGETPALVLNLVAVVLGGLTIGLVVRMTFSVLAQSEIGWNVPSDRMFRITSIIGAVSGALILGFGESLWRYSIQFTPYILTALFTVLILSAMLIWWKRARDMESYRWLFIIALLFGLDFSVHRTNLLLLPGLAVWILLRQPSTLFKFRAWRSGVLGLVSGLAVQLLVIPLAWRQPFFNSGDPGTLPRFWDYLSLKQYGGGWLMDMLPRKGALWSDQFMDYLGNFADNFFRLGGFDSILNVLILLFGLLGVVLLWTSNRRLALGMIVLFLLSSVGAVFYLNRPEGFFRSFDRHYLPSFIIFATWIGIGLASIPVALRQLQDGARVIASVIFVAVCVLLVGQQYRQNVTQVDGSNRTFCVDAARNYLATLPENAILFTHGDNDTYPLWYLQAAEGVRPDVTVCNIYLMNTDWFMTQVLSRDLYFPLTVPRDSLRQMTMMNWRDTAIAVPVSAAPIAFRLPDGTVIPETLMVSVPPTAQDKFLTIKDQVLMRIVQEHNWRRPLYFTYQEPWLQAYCRTEGLAYRLLPIENPPVNTEILQTNLFDRYNLGGYADNAVSLNQEEEWMGATLFGAFCSLAFAENQNGNTAACLEIRERMQTNLPVERIAPPEYLREIAQELCTEIVPDPVVSPDTTVVSDTIRIEANSGE